MNFFFENWKPIYDSTGLEEHAMRNFKDCKDVNESGMSRFCVSPLAGTIQQFGYENLKHCYIQPNYIISAGVQHSPEEWAGRPEDGRKSFMHFVKETHLENLQNGSAMLMLDSSLEGYHAPWLYKFMEDELDKHNVPHEAMVFVTGNLLAEEEYTGRMKVISYPHFEKDVGCMLRYQNLEKPTFEKHMEYKNVNEMKTFNVLQKRPRRHRCWLYSAIRSANLHHDCIMSMNEFPYKEFQELDYEGRLYEYDWIGIKEELPILVGGKDNVSLGDSHYIKRFNFDVCLQSWITVISEASFFDSDGTQFISEKTFKALGSRTPFIIFGNKGSLKRLKEWGYKTFDTWWDESYDELESWERFDAIVKLLKDLNNQNMMTLFSSMEETLDWNYHTLLRNSSKAPDAYFKLKQHYKEYFNVT